MCFGLRLSLRHLLFFALVLGSASAEQSQDKDKDCDKETDFINIAPYEQEPESKDPEKDMPSITTCKFADGWHILLNNGLQIAADAHGRLCVYNTYDDPNVVPQCCPDVKDSGKLKNKSKKGIYEEYAKSWGFECFPDGKIELKLVDNRGHKIPGKDSFIIRNIESKEQAEKMRPRWGQLSISQLRFGGASSQAPTEGTIEVDQWIEPTSTQKDEKQKWMCPHTHPLKIINPAQNQERWKVTEGADRKTKDCTKDVKGIVTKGRSNPNGEKKGFEHQRLEAPGAPRATGG